MIGRGRVGRGGWSDRGSSLVEALVAAAVASAVVGATLAALGPARDAFSSQPEAADLQQRVRAVVDVMRSNLLMAGAGVDGPAGALMHHFAPVRPYRLGEERNDPTAGVHFRAGTVSLLFVPPAWEETARPRQIGAVSVPVVTHTYYLRAGGPSDPAQLMHYDGLTTDLPVLDDVVGLSFEYFGEPAPPRLVTEDLAGHPVEPRTTYGPLPPEVGVDAPADGWGSGENCAFVVVEGRHEPRLPVLANGAALQTLSPAQLQDGPWCTAAAGADVFDADLLRIRRVHVRLRLQARTWFRGPAGRLFARAGTASSAAHSVPDQEIRFDIAPRNMNHGR